MGGNEDKEARLLTVGPTDRARSNGQQAHEISFHHQETLFYGKGYWAQVIQIVECTSLEIFKT